MGNYSKAEISFLRAIECATTDTVLIYGTKINLAQIFITKGDPKKALDILTSINTPDAADYYAIKYYNVLVKEAYRLKNTANIERNISILVIIGFGIIIFITWFFIGQRKFNAKLRLMYAKYIDAALGQAVYNIRKGKGDQAEKDVGLARSILDKIRRN